jgi:hypothetical protein
MTSTDADGDPQFQDALLGLHRGDFTRLAPYFEVNGTDPRPACRIVEWYTHGRFTNEPEALAEALTCACLLGQTQIAMFLLDQGLDPAAGIATGLNACHWAANRGHLGTVRLLIARHAPLEATSMYGGTVLGTAVWAAVHEPRADHLAIIEALVRAGAQLEAAGYPIGNERVDRWLRHLGAGDHGR